MGHTTAGSNPAPSARSLTTRIVGRCTRSPGSTVVQLHHVPPECAPLGKLANPPGLDPGYSQFESEAAYHAPVVQRQRQPAQNRYSAGSNPARRTTGDRLDWESAGLQTRYFRVRISGPLPKVCVGCRSGRGAGLQTPSYPVRVRAGAPNAEE